MRLWDAESGEELRQLTSHIDDVASVAFSPDGERIVSGSDDQTVRLWRGSMVSLLGQADLLIQRHPPSFGGNEWARFGVDRQPARAL